MYLDVNTYGEIVLNYKGLEPDEVGNTLCSLDYADGRTLEDVGGLLLLTRERIRQLEVEALTKFERRVRKVGFWRDYSKGVVPIYGGYVAWDF